ATPNVMKVGEGEDGVLAGAGEGHLIVDHSTIRPSVTVGLAEGWAERGVRWVEAPVSGGSEGAERGTLSVMVGGEAADVERARRYMDAYSTTVTHVGPVGSGQIVKLVNQVLGVVNQLASSEALLLAHAAGVAREAALKTVEG